MRHLGQIGAIVVDMRGENAAFAFFGFLNLSLKCYMEFGM